MHKAGRQKRRQSKQGKPVPAEVPQPPFMTDEELGACDGCHKHRCQGPYGRDTDGHLLIRCEAAEYVVGEKMVRAQTDKADPEQCEYATHMSLR